MRSTWYYQTIFWFVASSSGQLTELQPKRNLQAESCEFIDFAKAIECTESSATGNDVRYVLSCPVEATEVIDCFDTNKQVCYLFNNAPCSRGTYCSAENQLSLDCSNIFSRSLGSTCSSTDCSGSCTSLVEDLTPYPKEPNQNTCTSIGFTITCVVDQTNGGCSTETTEWIDILEDSTRIYASRTVESNGQSVSCNVTTADGHPCSCRPDCPTSISYDCSRVSSDSCAVRDCDGICIPHEEMSIDLDPAMTSRTLAPTRAPFQSLAPAAAPSPQPPQEVPTVPPRPIINWSNASKDTLTTAPALSPVASGRDTDSSGEEQSTIPDFSVANPNVWGPTVWGQPPPTPQEISRTTFPPIPIAPWFSNLPPVFHPTALPPTPWIVRVPTPEDEPLFSETGSNVVTRQDPQLPEVAGAPGPPTNPPLIPDPPLIPQPLTETRPGVVNFEVSNPDFFGPVVNHPWFKRFGRPPRKLEEEEPNSHAAVHGSWGRCSWVMVLCGYWFGLL